MSSKLPTVAPPPKKGKLPPIQLPALTNGQQLPAVARALNPIKALHNFADKARDLKEHCARMVAACENLDGLIRFPYAADRQKYVDTASKLLSRYDSDFHEMAKELRSQKGIFNPRDAYDEDGAVVEERVWKHIGLLLSSYPNANPGNEEAYVSAMVGEVLTVRFSEIALKLACSQIRKTSKFPPTTAEVIEAIEEQQELWSSRCDAIECCEDIAEELREKLKVATEIVAAQQAEREEQRRAAQEKKRADDELRAKPLEVGDRVRWNQTLGTITEQCQEESSDGFIVLLDDRDSWYVERKELERVIPGDPGYEITAVVQKNDTRWP
jgi:hypothetical protein